MTINHIPPQAFIPHGMVVLSTDSDLLTMSTETAINTHYHRNDSPIMHYASLDRKFKLPFRIDMTLKIDSPAIYLVIGRGHIEFGTAIDENRCITDILGGDYKPNSHLFNHDIPFGEYIDFSVTYGRVAMWVTVNGECRCVSDSDTYIKALLKKQIPDEFIEGFGLKIACDKLAQLTVKSLVVTEYDDDEPSVPTEIKIDRTPELLAGRPKKSTLEECVGRLDPDIKAEILFNDTYFLKDKKQTLKFKRNIEGGYPYSRITYVSIWGFRYKIIISEDYVWHDINWISYNSKREQAKYGGYKKADYTTETLNKLAETSPDFADEMFYRIKECVFCAGAGGCPNKTVYEFNGKKKRACGWSDGM